MLSHLLIMRHAKSSWADETQTDHQRPLNLRGRESADVIAATLTARGFAPDIIWSSDAQRTKETAIRMIRVIPGPQQVFYQPEFYMASANKALQVCGSADEPSGKLMLLGHNPGWSNLFNYFSGTHHRYPTATCAVFTRKDESADWLTADAWQLKDILIAREIMQ